MNSYTITLNSNFKFVKKFLIDNSCPKAAATVNQIGNQASFVIEGNVSACSMYAELTQMGYNVNVAPVGNSQSMPAIYMS
jgi:hypothetical protein